MKWNNKIAITTILYALVGTPLLLAQEQENVGQKYDTRYSKEVFNEADTDHDGFISWDEANKASLQVERDLFGRERFNAADLNNDGRLSAEEVGTYKRKEKTHKKMGVTKTKRRKGSGGSEVPTHGNITEKRAKIEDLGVNENRTTKIKRRERASVKQKSQGEAAQNKKRSLKTHRRGRSKYETEQ